MKLRFVLRDGKRILQSYEKISTGWVVDEYSAEELPGALRLITPSFELTPLLPPRETFEYKWVDVPLEKVNETK